jgi:hypothetical protein
MGHCLKGQRLQDLSLCVPFLLVRFLFLDVYLLDRRETPSYYPRSARIDAALTKFMNYLSPSG